MFISAPTSSFGYYRGAPLYGGGANGGGGSGPQMAGTNVFSQGQGPTGTSSEWSPTILYMFGLIILEMIVFGILSRKI
jgi:hypothetical protein